MNKKSIVIFFLVVEIIGLFAFLFPGDFKFAPLVGATTETRYMHKENQSTANYFWNSTSPDSSSYFSFTTGGIDDVPVYMGAKVYVFDGSWTRTCVSGASTIARQSYTPTGVTHNTTISVTWTHSQLDYTIKAVQIEVYYDTNNPATTIKGNFITANYSTYQDFITSNTWTFYYSIYELYSGGTSYMYLRGDNNPSWVSRVEGYEVGRNPTPPTYNVYGFTQSTYWANCTVSYYANWTALGGESLYQYLVSTTNTAVDVYTNGSWIAFSGSTWSNNTFATNTTRDGYVAFKIFAKDTAGYQNVTSESKVPITAPVPTLSSRNFGQTASWFGTVSDSVYVKSAVRWGIYVGYGNSSVTPWKYYIRAFDVNSSLWTDAYYVDNCDYDDPGHILPAVNKLGDGRLIFAWAYFGNLSYHISTYSTDSETNLTKLISNWGPKFSIKDPWYSKWSYPFNTATTNALTIFGRVGTSSGANQTYTQYKTVTNEPWYVSSFDSTYAECSFNGSSPYLDDNDLSYLRFTASNQKAGYFGFSPIEVNENGRFPNNFSSVYLDIYQTVAGTVQILKNSSTLIGTTTAATGWQSFNVTAYIQKPDDITTFKFFLNSSTGSAFNVSRARLLISYTGFTAPVLWAYRDENSPGSVYWRSWCNGTYILMVGYGYYITDENVYFAYSSDEGSTWKYANGTSAGSLPLNATNLIISNVTNPTERFRALTAIIDENQQITVLYEDATNVYSYQAPMFILQYNTTIGSSGGSWVNYTMTDENNSPLFGFPSGIMLFRDPYFSFRPTVWMANGTSGVLKLTRIYGYANKFLKVVVDSTHIGWFDNALIYNCGEAYQVVASFAQLDYLGTYNFGQSQTAYLNSTEIYACKFLANFTGTLSAGCFGGSSYAFNERFALYDGSGVLLGQGSSQSGITGSSLANGWFASVSLPSTCTITQGQYYWIAFEVDTTTQTKANYTAATFVNQTVVMAYNGTVLGDFPSTLTPKTSNSYYNWSLTVNAYPHFIYVYGLGFSECPSIYGTHYNDTHGGLPIQITATVEDNIALNQWRFSTNNTGPWTNSSWYSFTGSPQKTGIAYNFTLNATEALTIGFYFYAQDNDGNVGKSYEDWLVVYEGIAPWYASIGWTTNQTNAACAFSVHLYDNKGVDGYIFMWNGTGGSSLHNETWIDLGGTYTDIVASPVYTLPVLANTKVMWMFWFNDTSNNWNWTSFTTLTTTDIYSPVPSGVTKNTTVAGYTCSFTCYWTDGSGLDRIFFGFYNGSSWDYVSATYGGISATWANYTRVLNFTQGTLIQYVWNATNINGNGYSTPVYQFTTTGTGCPYVLLDPGYTTQNANASCTFYIQWADDVSLGTIYLMHNNTGTGSFTNYTCAVYGNPSWGNMTVTLNSTTGNVIVYKWFAWDGAGNSNSTGNYSLTIADITPPVFAIYGDHGYTDTLAGYSSLFSAYVYDNTAFSTSDIWRFYSNNTGTFGMEYEELINTPSNSKLIQYNMLLRSTVGDVVMFQWAANDSTGAWGFSDYYYLTTTRNESKPVGTTPAGFSSLLVIFRFVDDNGTKLKGVRLDVYDAVTNVSQGFWLSESDGTLNFSLRSGQYSWAATWNNITKTGAFYLVDSQVIDVKFGLPLDRSWSDTLKEVFMWIMEPLHLALIGIFGSILMVAVIVFAASKQR